jgi:hypothetical protein
VTNGQPRVNPGVLYSAGRFGCFLAVAAVLYAVGLRSWLLVLASLALSAPLSFVLLRRVRLAWSVQIDQQWRRRKQAKEKLRAALRGDDTPAA